MKIKPKFADRQSNKTRSAVYAAILGLLSSGCSSVGEQVSDIVFVPHPSSAVVKNDSTSLSLIHEEPPGTPAIAAPAAAALIGAGLNQIQKSLEAESKRYVATYSAGRTEIRNQFAEYPLKGLLFERHVRVNREEGQDGDLAMRFCAAIEAIDKNEKFFALRPYGIDFHNSKAKVIAFDMLSPFGFDLLNPWELITDWFGDGPKFPADNTVDLVVKVEFQNLILDTETKQPKVIPLGVREFRFKGIELQNAANEDESENALIKNSCDGYDGTPPTGNLEKLDLKTVMAFPAPTETGSPDTIYNVSVTVTEVDEFGERVKDLSDTFKENRPAVQNQLNDLFSGSP